MKIFHPLFISASILLSPIQYLGAADKPLYQIIGVKSWDTLNLRSSPGVSNKVIAKIPANEKAITRIGTQVVIGKTVWVKVIWQGKQGWVSKAYLKKMTSNQPKSQRGRAKGHVAPIQKTLGAKPSTAKKIIVPKKAIAKPAPKLLALKEARSGEWILSCGNSSPFWKVEVHPEILKMFKGNYKAKLPITYKKQKKNRWNIAKRTHLKGVSAKDKLDLDIRFSYSKCEDSLSKLKVPYKATMTHNGEKMTGCCRAMRLP
ncbi:MAG: hypothetical protein DSZ29_00115 [Aquificaceae bacterium]|nr:MAG: hypothetical protein DSZ29_00115 [Aquificaceae bacterium]